jgi:hypothetical protein
LRHALHADFWDVKLMSSYIRDLIHDHDFRQQVIDGQTEDLQHATWQQAGEKVSSVYRKLLKGSA